ncbi:MarR family winged helix-turn-helix transcriptional regulator [Corynebacterium uberis]|uniref:MarR family winged helix-turn-helix transcriptional regulator n=1 Tax=Corynebacterium TaxID=1716 RepID=UPI001D0A4D17|nr:MULTISPECIES: MarR family winged helix-turn-helix transcriptional regulator [Corynebacterium]MCZ9309737.1 MarR family winged helix-turn-helix transcriptional regulator [Corynebacterium sp. c6VSa_13]UDL73541.1 MarR family winged helix-turn-helix transcriptional regulator [Corynebacterium uberis]UDL75579.1 MarR family winged helix-turn-helix transcriptional regulator [Corynebacterium uberis]UDL77792.1 MarR family winged helix-turn-helix transcriptional regulator [Corynebacterium uberis]UDL800
MSSKKAPVSAPAIPPALLQSPSFQLERLRRRTRDEVESRLAEHSTSLREYWVLTCLDDGDATSQTALSATLMIDTSDMVRLVDSLEKHGWAARERDPKDRRRQIVAITKKGHKARADLEKLVTRGEDEALDESTSKQLKHLRKLAKAIIATEDD